MKSNYVRRAEKFMREFYPYMRKYSFSHAVRHFNEEKHRCVQFAHGTVRRVLITSDYVVKWDYNADASRRYGGCRDEYKMYLNIKNSEYSYLFAEITPIRVKSRIFYVMPRVDSLGLDHDADIYDVLSDDEYNFVCDEVGITDLHDENWGFLHGNPIIIDYACDYNKITS